MCVICVKPVGVKHPTKEVVNQMCDKNPDGFGLATIEDGKIVVKKTMKQKEYWKWVKAIPDNVPCVMHMRIATHGSINVNNCHPFKSDGGKWAFAHNGILSIKNEGDWTDSETFFKRIAMPLINGGYTPESEVFDKMIDCIIGGSKFVFLHENGYLKMYGNFIFEKESGLYFSNDSYKKYTWGSLTSKNNTTYSWKSGLNWGSDYYMDDYEDWWIKNDKAPFDDTEDTGTCGDYLNMDGELYSEIFDEMYECIMNYGLTKEECLDYSESAYNVSRAALEEIYRDAYTEAIEDLSLTDNK